MNRHTGAPLVAAALSGFIVGVLLTLFASGTVLSGAHTPTAAPVATLPPSKPVARSQLYQRVERIVVKQLGLLYPNQKVPRVAELKLLPIGSGLPEPGSIPPDGLARYRSIYIRFRLNDHPLGRIWRLRAAQADVFAVMHALYLSRLPVYNVEMEGVFPLKVGGRTEERQALVAYMGYRNASHIPWRKWGRENEGRLWSLLPYRLVDPQFA